MSADLTVYMNRLTDDLIPVILKRFNDFEMECEIEPNFSFDDFMGVIYFKIRFKNTQFEIVRDKWLISSFDLIVEPYDYIETKEYFEEKPSFFAKLFGRKQILGPLVDEKIDNKLKNCTKVLLFNSGNRDSFSFRLASLVAAILTELTNGICFNENTDSWSDSNGLVENILNQIKEYETNLLLNKKKLYFNEFEKWYS